MNKRRIWKRIKKRLVKKVTLYEYLYEHNVLTFYLELENFWSIRKKIDATFYNQEVKETLDCNISKNKLSIDVPMELLQASEGRSRIKLVINNKTMWITESFDVRNNNILIGNKYFITYAEKQIYISNKFSELTFNDYRLTAKNITTDYNSFQFNLPLDHVTLKDERFIEVYAFNQNKMRVLQTEVSHENLINVLDTSILSNGAWRLFAYINEQLYPIGYRGGSQLDFVNYEHKMSISAINDNFYLNVKAHLFELEKIEVIEQSKEQIRIILFSDRSAVDKYELIMDDINNKKEDSFPLVCSDRELYVDIPSNEFYKTLGNKRFFVKMDGDQVTKSQFSLKGAQLEGSSKKFAKKIDSQLVKFKFYVRKDKSLGLSIRKPSLRKIITSVNDFKVTGSLGSLQSFVDVTAFLSFEDRESLDKVRIPIEGDFSIDLNLSDLISIKSKGKTVIDFFVEIENDQGEIIRKEKIKFKYSNYKKDNYYAYQVKEDSDNNQHHFLVTTTPFNNLKIETFMIPNEVEIPKNTVRKVENIWLLGERYNTAQDNGIVLFRWLLKNTDIDAYYVIESGSEDYEKVKNHPKVLTFGSKEHFDIAFKAKVLLGTHDLENILPYKPAKGFFHYEDTIKIFLQHGVLGRKNVEYHKKFYEIPFDLFIVSSDEEKYDIVMRQMGYEDEEVAVTGLARFDQLVQTDLAKDILLMPTWRDWINSDQAFLESEYFAAYSNLINNTRLHELLEKYDVNLNFYPHYRAQDFFKDKMKDLSGRVHFIPFGSKHVQELLIEHALLLTDFSSVSFDFLKMDKPIIYYHFDVRRFFKRGILRPIEETFIGGIAHTEEELIGLIEDRLIHQFDNYSVDISGVIKYQDRESCKRIYTEVLKKLEDKKAIEIEMN